MAVNMVTLPEPESGRKRHGESAIFGCGQFRTFRSGFGFGQRYHVDRHGQLTLKQLRLSVLNEVHTNYYLGPRLYLIHTHRLSSYSIKSVLYCMTLCILYYVRRKGWKVVGGQIWATAKLQRTCR